MTFICGYISGAFYFCNRASFAGFPFKWDFLVTRTIPFRSGFKCMQLVLGYTLPALFSPQYPQLSNFFALFWFDKQRDNEAPFAFAFNVFNESIMVYSLTNLKKKM